MSQPYHIYLDLDVLNNDAESGAKPHSLVFEQTRNTPFLEGDCSNYFCSIIRFSIQTGSSLPVFIPRIDTSQPDPNQTVYKITLRHGIKTYTQNIAYKPPISAETNYYDLRRSGGDLSVYSRPDYYHVKNYQDFIKMVNASFKRLFGAALGGA
jgi:hypothetical protein